MDILTLEKTNPKFSFLFSKLLHPPNTLYAMGNLELLNYSSISIVGSRTPSTYGLSLCNKFTKCLVEKRSCHY